MKIVSVIGARPQFIKAAVISHAIATHNKRQGASSVEEVLVHTGQHFDVNMSQVFFEELGIPAARHNLGIDSLSHSAMTGRMLEALEKVFREEQPDWVVVYGDTNSTLAGALAASQLHIRLAHVEAGLRSFNKAMPEEQNRLLTDRLADALFCPTEAALEQLHQEHIADSPYNQKAWFTGDVMYDAAIRYLANTKPGKRVRKLLDGTGADFALCTLHRAENIDDAARRDSLLQALNALAEKLPVLFPVHPRTRKAMGGTSSLSDRVHLVEPVSYFEMLHLLQQTKMVLTDSGGLQKEASFCRKPCIVLRSESEWMELVNAGVNHITGCRMESINQAFEKYLDFTYPADLPPFFGDGKAGDRIVELLLSV